MEKLVELKNITKSFGDKKVLDNFSLAIKKGESVVMLGRSGVGKSVATRIMLGLLPPDSGLVKFFGHDITDAAQDTIFALNKKSGMLFQNAALFDSMSVWENVAFALMNNQRVPAERARKIAVQKLAMVGLPGGVADLDPSELSGGMKKRVGLARAIAADPEMIFFDEPTTGLDPIMSNVINQLIKNTVKKLGATSFTITHDIASARKIATRVVVLDGGKIVWEGTPAELSTTTHPFVRKFVDGTVDKSDSDFS